MPVFNPFFVFFYVHSSFSPSPLALTQVGVYDELYIIHIVFLSLSLVSLFYFFVITCSHRSRQRDSSSITMTIATTNTAMMITYIIASEVFNAGGQKRQRERERDRGEIESTQLTFSLKRDSRTKTFSLLAKKKNPFHNFFFSPLCSVFKMKYKNETLCQWDVVVGRQKHQTSEEA